MKKVTEENIIDKLQRGEHGAFTYIYNLFYRRIIFFATSLLKDEAEAQDITSKIFLKVWDRRDSFSSLSRIKSFLYISVKNACYDFLLAQKRLAIRQKDINSSIDVIEIKNAEYLMYRSELIAILHKEIEDLPEKTREIVKLFFFEELSSQQISEKINVSLKTVRNLKSIALKNLKTIFLKKYLSSL